MARKHIHSLRGIHQGARPETRFQEDREKKALPEACPNGRYGGSTRRGIGKPRSDHGERKGDRSE